MRKNSKPVKTFRLQNFFSSLQELCQFSRLSGHEKTFPPQKSCLFKIHTSMKKRWNFKRKLRLSIFVLLKVSENVKCERHLWLERLCGDSLTVFWDVILFSFLTTLKKNCFWKPNSFLFNFNTQSHTKNNLIKERKERKKVFIIVLADKKKEEIHRKY